MKATSKKDSNSKYQQKLLELIDEYDGGIKQDFAKRIQRSPQQLNNMLSGRANIGNKIRNELIAIGVSMQWWDHDIGPIRVSTDMVKNEERSKMATDKLHDASIEILNSLSKLPIRSIPLFNHVAAGEPVEVWNHHLSQIIVPEVLLKELKNPIAFMIKGDSMSEKVKDGDIVFGEKITMNNVKDNDEVVMSINSDEETRLGLLKIFKWLDKPNGKFILQSNKPGEPIREFNASDVLQVFRIKKHLINL